MYCNTLYWRPMQYDDCSHLCSHCSFDVSSIMCKGVSGGTKTHKVCAMHCVLRYAFLCHSMMCAAPAIKVVLTNVRWTQVRG